MASGNRPISATKLPNTQPV